MLVTQVNPSYPLQALQQHAQGDVLVRLIIGKDGVPRNLQVVRGNPLLVTAALGVIPRWRYKPALLNGQPTEAQTVVTVSFHLK
jgi:protein TonB